MADDSKSVRKWMQPFGIGEGDWLCLTKEQLKLMQRPGVGHTLKCQIWATGILHSAGYRGERALTMRNGKEVPLTPTDIARELHRIAVSHYRTAGVKDEIDFKTITVSKENIRRKLSELELDGAMERRTLDGRAIKDIPAAEARRLSGGKIVLHFFLKPKATAPDTVKAEWELRKIEHTQKVEVVQNGLPLPSISQILKTFQIPLPAKELLTNSQYQKTVADAWGKTRAFFLAQIEVVSTVDPLVVPVQPPEGGQPGGTFERIGERKEGKAGGRASSLEREPASQPDPLLAELTKMGFLLEPEWMVSLRAALGECPDAELLVVVRDRMKRGAFGPPVLLKLAEKALKLWSALETDRAEESRKKQAERERADARMRDQAREVLANPQDFTPEELEWAREVCAGKRIA
jgi:hypothetical protein